jgi:hypothetical protein
MAEVKINNQEAQLLRRLVGKAMSEQEEMVINQKRHNSQYYNSQFGASDLAAYQQRAEMMAMLYNKIDHICKDGA